MLYLNIYLRLSYLIRDFIKEEVLNPVGIFFTKLYTENKIFTVIANHKLQLYRTGSYSFTLIKLK